MTQITSLAILSPWAGCPDSGFLFLGLFAVFHFRLVAVFGLSCYCMRFSLARCFFGAGEIVPHMPVWGNMITLGRLVTVADQPLDSNNVQYAVGSRWPCR